jgi:hypothetical protein
VSSSGVDVVCTIADHNHGGALSVDSSQRGRDKLGLVARAIGERRTMHGSEMTGDLKVFEHALGKNSRFGGHDPQPMSSPVELTKRIQHTGKQVVLIYAGRAEAVTIAFHRAVKDVHVV